MIKIKKLIKFLLPILILAIFVFSPTSVTANIGLTIGHNGLTLDSFNNLLYGNLSPASHASSSFFLFQKNSSDVVRLDNFGNFTTLGNIGIGLSNPSSALQIANNNWISALNAGGSGSINMFKVNSNNQIEVGAALNIGSFEFTPDSGLVSFLDMPVTSSSVIGTPHGYIFKTDSENILTIYSESNGSGGIQNKRVGINTFLPGSALEIRGGGSTSASSALNVTNSGAVSSLFVRNDGNIGVGLTNPAYTLDVNGSANLNSISFGITPGESQLQALATVDYVNNKVGSGGGSSLWSENGSNIYYSLGNVGIGTSAPSFPLVVYGGSTTVAEFRNYVGNMSFINMTDLTTGPGASNGLSLGYSINQALINNNENTPLSFATDATIRMRLSATGGLSLGSTFFSSNPGANNLIVEGNIGIGKTNPGSSLDVNGSANLNSISFGITPGESQLQALATVDYVNNKVGSGGGSSLWSENGSNIYYSLGNVGIGTTNPVQQLEITNNFRMPLTSGNTQGVIYQGNSRFIHSQGTNNVFIGQNAGNFTLTSSNNVAIGAQALLNNTSGGLNVAIGYNSLAANNTGVSNVAIGARSMSSNTSGYTNIAIGVDALDTNTTGIGNISIGYWSAATTGSFNDLNPTNSIYIGHSILGFAGDESNTIVLGSNNTSLGSNSVLIGNNSTLKTVLKGNVGIGSTSPSYTLDVNGSANLNSISFGITPGESQLQALATVDYVNNKVGSGGGSSLWSENGSNIYYSLGNVGIGTTAPVRQLEIAGTGRIRLSGSGPDIGFVDTSSGGVPWRIVSGQAAIGSFAITDDVSGLYRFFISSTGNVGVGTTAPASIFDVVNTGASSFLPVANFLAPNNISSGNASQIRFGVALSTRNTAEWRYVHQGSGSTSNRVDFGMNGVSAPVLTYNFASNVGIGTTNPSRKLHIMQASSGSAVSHANTTLLLENNGNVFLEFLGSQSSEQGIYFSDNSAQPGAIKFYHNAHATGPANSLELITSLNNPGHIILTPGSNVGIGLTNPSQKLHISGGLQLDSVSFGVTPGEAQTLALATVDYVNNKVGSGGQWTTTSTNIFYNSGHVIIGAEDSSTRLHVETAAGPVAFFKSNLLGGTYAGYIGNLQTFSLEEFGLYTLPQYRLAAYDQTNGLYLYGGFQDTDVGITIDSLSGNVGIGTTAPSYKLDVNGAINATSLLVNGSPVGGGSGLWTANGSNIYYNSGNVGIGTTAPSYKLDLKSTINGDVLFINAPGGVTPNFTMSGDGEQTFRFYNTASTGNTRVSWKMANRLNTDWTWIIYTDSSGTGVDDWQLRNRNAAVLFANSAGNIGMGGNTNPTSGTLTVTGNISASTGLRIGATDVITSGRVVRAADGTVSAPAFSFSADTNNGMYRMGTDMLGFSTASVNRMTILANGNIGIGLTNPSSVLHVYEGTTAGKSLAFFRDNPNISSLEIISRASDIISLTAGASDTLRLAANNSTTGHLEIISNGNIGIGTTAPAYKLDVNGTINATSVLVNGSPISGGGSSVWSENGTDIIYYNSGKVGIGTSLPSYLLTIENSSSGENILGELTGSFAKTWSTANREGFLLNSRYTGQSLNWNVALINWGYADSIANGGSRLGFDLVNTSGDWLNVMTMTGSGNVGIGTTAPAEKLDVEGNVEADAYYYSSDIRLKTDIKTLNNSLEKIKKLNPVAFAWKKDGVLSQGFIAQEVEWVLPELVKTNQETNLKSVQYANLTAILVAGMKEQQMQIEKLQAEVRLLQQKLSGLEK